MKEGRVLKSFRLIPPLGPGRAADPGVIGRHAPSWDIAGERATSLGGITALMLQIGNKIVADGVTNKSTFQDEPLKRLVGTLQALLVMTFGDHEQAQAMAEYVATMHRPVHGKAGDRVYSAFNPDACLWVWATLVELALEAYSLFVRELTWDERAWHYEASKPVAKLFRVPADKLPGSYREFRGFYESMLGQLVVDEQALHIAHVTIHLRFHGIPFWPMSAVVAAGFMPTDELRQAFHLKWGPVTRLTWRMFVRAVRSWVRYAPARQRRWPHFYTAYTRVRAPYGGAS